MVAVVAVRDQNEGLTEEEVVFVVHLEAPGHVDQDPIVDRVGVIILHVVLKVTRIPKTLYLYTCNESCYTANGERPSS